MSAPPYLPADFKSLIPAANASWCKKLTQIPGLLAVYTYRMKKWQFNDDGTPTDGYKAWLGLATSTTLTAPTNVTASDGTSSSSVVVSWTATAGASYYTIYRSTGSVFSGASVLGTSTTTSYTDSSVTVDTIYTYWVKANSASAASDESVPDTGFAQSSGATSRTITVSGDFVVPTGVTSITATVVAKGGNGGARGSSPWGVIGVLYPGGGGGGGEVCEGTFSTTPGESLAMVVEPTGTAVKRSSTVLISCVPGSVGANGYTSPGGAGGNGGTGGTTDGSVSSVTRAAGDNGTAGSGSSGGVGGDTNPVVSGYGTGGNGSDAGSDTNTSGLNGVIILNW